jgi:hypothetical protein
MPLSGRPDGPGVPEDSLAQPEERPGPAGSLVIPLIVLSDFVARGVPVTSASNTVLAATRAGASRSRAAAHARAHPRTHPAGRSADRRLEGRAALSC